MTDDMSVKMIGLGIYLSVLLVIGWAASRRMHDIRDYVVGGKRLGFWSVAFSARATGESAWLLLGLTGMGAAIGVRAFWVVAGEILGVAGAWLLLARRFKRLTDRYDSVTVPDYLESRFGDRSHALRIVAAAALVVFVTIYVSAQIDATGQAFEGADQFGVGCGGHDSQGPQLLLQLGEPGRYGRVADLGHGSSTLGSSPGVRSSPRRRCRSKVTLRLEEALRAA